MAHLVNRTTRFIGRLPPGPDLQSSAGKVSCGKNRIMGQFAYWRPLKFQNFPIFGARCLTVYNHLARSEPMLYKCISYYGFQPGGGTSPLVGDWATSGGHEMTTALKKLSKVVLAVQGLAPNYWYSLTTGGMGWRRQWQEKC